MLGMVLGGAVLGGEAGAQLGMLGAAAWMTKYSREYETQADQLGAQIMADAGYDPRDHRTDPPGVYSGYVLLALVIAGLFLL